MGIPTVKRKVKSYLSETLRSLIDKLSPEEKLDCVIIVFVGEVRSHIPTEWVIARCFCTVNSKVLVWSLQTDVDYVHSVVAGLEKEWVHFSASAATKRWICVCVSVSHCQPSSFRFSTELSSGLLEVISPPAAYYPDLTNLKETFGDSKERVRWAIRTGNDVCVICVFWLLIRKNVIEIIMEIMEKPALREMKCRRAVMRIAEKVEGWVRGKVGGSEQARAFR